MREYINKSIDSKNDCKIQNQSNLYVFVYFLLIKKIKVWIWTIKLFFKTNRVEYKKIL